MKLAVTALVNAVVSTGLASCAAWSGGGSGSSSTASLDGISKPDRDGLEIEIKAPESMPHARFTVAGADLGDTAAVQRIRHRVRLHRFGRAWLKLDERGTDRDSHVDIDWLPALPVIAETANRIRVVAGDDHARFALWIDRNDAALTTRVPMQLSDEHGRADPDHGVWLEAGAPLVVRRNERSQDGDRRFVELHDTRMIAGGWLPSAVIGQVWIAADDDRHPLAMEEVVMRDLGEPGPTVAEDAVIASAPRNDAPVIARASDGVHARLLGTSGAWREVQIDRPYVRVRGYVRADALRGNDSPIGHGSGSGSGWGMSRTLQIDVPAGACLYDGESGEVIGVATARDRRRAEPLSHGWWRILLGTRWGLMFVVVHDVANSPDAEHVSVEPCVR